MITIERLDFNADVACYKNLPLRSDVKRAFPMFFHPAFQRSILGIRQIVEETTQKGLIFNLRPYVEFRAFGLLETALLVFPEFQRQGIGNSVISLLNSDKVSTFFVSATSNKASSAFFGRQSELVLTHENERYRVYQTAS
jgi:hypothetical protein